MSWRPASDAYEGLVWVWEDPLGKAQAAVWRRHASVGGLWSAVGGPGFPRHDFPTSQDAARWALELSYDPPVPRAD